MVILQDKYGLHLVEWGHERRKGVELQKFITKPKHVVAILNCMIYLELIDREIKKIQDTDTGFWSYWERTRERISDLQEALKCKLKKKEKEEANP